MYVALLYKLFLNTSAILQAPAITSVVRFDPGSVSITVEIPENERAELEYFEVNFYNSTGSRSLDLLVRS